MVENPTLWDEVKPVDNFPDYRLSDIANPTRCHRCQSVVWHLLSRAGFEIKLDPERLDLAAVIEIAKKGKTFIFPTMRMGDSFVANFLISTTDRAIVDADYEKVVHLAWHRCNPDNIRTEVINHWKGRR